VLEHLDRLAAEAPYFRAPKPAIWCLRFRLDVILGARFTAQSSRILERRVVAIEDKDRDDVDERLLELGGDKKSSRLTI